MSAIGAQQSLVINQFRTFVDINETEGPKALKKAAEQFLNGHYNSFISRCLFLPKWEAEECVQLSNRIGFFSERTGIGQIIKAVKHRFSSLTQNSKNCQESEPLYHQEGAWIFDSKRSDFGGGYLYVFRMQSVHFKADMDRHINSMNPNHVRNPAFQHLIENLNLEQFPAVELELRSILDLQRKIGKNILNALGYSFGDVTDEEFSITLPDKWALEVRWALLQETQQNMELPDLRIIDSGGVASDLDFARGYRRGLILAKGREFIHDHLHILAKIARCVKSANLEKQMTATLDRIIGSWLGVIKSLKAKINDANSEELQQQISELEMILGAFVDISSVASSFGVPHFYERESFIPLMKEMLRLTGGVVTDTTVLKALELIESRSDILPIEKFLNLSLDENIIKYIRRSSGWSIQWERRFGYPFNEEKFDKIVSLLTTTY